MREKASWIKILLLQLVVGIYSVNTVIAKLVSGQKVFSPAFIGLLFLEVCVLGVYALLWQQLIKHFELSVAYANKAMGLIWSLIWSIVLFREGVKWNQLLGIVLVMIGIICMNGDEKTTEKESVSA
ncbi:MAG: transporter [Lachnospiraceae bacterium]|nr:transporter [Lachnospiraceae bacterium]